MNILCIYIIISKHKILSFNKYDVKKKYKPRNACTYDKMIIYNGACY